MFDKNLCSSKKGFYIYELRNDHQVLFFFVGNFTNSSMNLPSDATIDGGALAEGVGVFLGRRFRLSHWQLLCLGGFLIGEPSEEASGYGLELRVVHLRLRHMHNHGCLYRKLSQRCSPGCGGGAAKEVLELRSGCKHGQVGCTGSRIVILILCYVGYRTCVKRYI